MPFAIVGTDPSGGVGVATAGPSPAGDDWLTYLEPAIGVVVHHGLASTVGARAFDLLRGGLPASELTSRLALDARVSDWQLLVLDVMGRGGARSGRGSAPAFGHTLGSSHVAGGTALTSPNVVGAMSLSFERSAGDLLGQRLLLALESGERAGSDVRGLQSAAIRVAARDQRSTLDLQVRDHPDPIGELWRLLYDRRGHPPP